MKKMGMKREFLGKFLLLCAGVLLLFNCGDPNGAPNGASVVMGDDISFEADYDQPFGLGVLVLDEYEQPMNDIELTVGHSGPKSLVFLYYNGEYVYGYTTKTNEYGRHTIELLVDGDYEGDFEVSASTNVASDSVKISKTIPKE